MHSVLFRQYVLGDFWLIDALKALAIYKLHKALCIFELDGKNVADIVDLVRYAYEEEGKGLEDGITVKPRYKNPVDKNT